MKLFTKGFFGVIFSVLTVVSCQKDVVVPDSPSVQAQSDYFTVENSRIVFGSANDFKSQIQSLRKLSTDELSTWNEKIKVQSLFEVSQEKEALTNTNGRLSANDEEELNEIVNDKHFASILNSDGEFVIGKQVIRVTPNIVFIGNKSLATQIRQMDPKKYADLAVNKHIVDQGVIVGRVSHLPAKSANARVSFNGVDHTIFDWDGSHRTATVIYNDNWLVYRSIGTKVKFQNKRWWGGWWEDNTDALHMDYGVTYDVSRVTGFSQFITVTPPPRFCQDCGNITDTIDFDVAEIGFIGDTPGGNLITDPYDFTTFNTNSYSVWRGNWHFDNLQVTK